MTVNFRQEELEQFTCTTQYYKSSLFIPDLFHTDGVQHVVENGGGWMVDVVASYQIYPKVREAEFQVWDFKINAQDHTCCVTCRDGMGEEAPPLAVQNIPYTDLPFDLKMFLELGSLDMIHPAWVLLLPSEH